MLITSKINLTVRMGQFVVEHLVYDELVSTFICDYVHTWFDISSNTYVAVMYTAESELEKVDLIDRLYVFGHQIDSVSFVTFVNDYVKNSRGLSK